MMRAVALAARLDFKIDQESLDAIHVHRHEIARSSPPRLLEEYYKILRAGSSEKAFRGLAEVGLLQPISSELHKGAAEPLWQALASLDAYRRRFDSMPDTLSNGILLGSLLVPLGISLHPARGAGTRDQVESRSRSGGDQVESRSSAGGDEVGGRSDRTPRRAPGPRLGELPLARRDIERLRLIVSLQRRLRDLSASPKAQRALAHRAIFREALTWLEIHGGAPELVEHWKAILAEGGGTEQAVDAPGDTEDQRGLRPRRRRRRRRGRRGAPTSGS